MSDIIAIYADGGVIGANPSATGGTFAWCHVARHKIRVAEGSGVITPGECGLPEITNNLTEFLAVVRGLQNLPAGWSGTVYSDSRITLGRFFESWSMKGIPLWLVQEGGEAMARLDWQNCRGVLLDGHPTKKQLASGLGKRGNPVSIFNVWCDKACGQEAAKFKKSTVL